MKRLFSYIQDLISSRYIIFQLTKRSVSLQYRRLNFGMFWSLGEPLAYMGVLYLVFGIGLRGGRDMEIPFITYLVSGMAVINFFNQTMSKGTSSIRSHSYLLKKVNFRMSILPVVTVISGIVDHLLFMVAVFVILLINTIFPTIYWFQLFYYLFALAGFLLGITLFTSAVGVFFPDLQQIVGVLSRMLFYFSPIFWSFDMLSDRLKFIVNLNPVCYIVMGYRDSLFYGIPFWDKPVLTLYFWGWTLFMLIIGTFVFIKLRPQFSDFA